MPGKFLFKFFDESSYRVALWDLIRKSKISGQYLHTVTYQDMEKNFFNSATLFFKELFSNLNWLKLRTGQTQKRWNFWNISNCSRVISEFFFFLTVFKQFTAFFLLFWIKKYAKNRLIKIEQFCFFPWKRRHRAFCTC